MFFAFAMQSPPPPPRVMAQTGSSQIPKQLSVLLDAKDWSGLADWFEGASPAIRGQYYEIWLQALNRSHRWGRLVVVCDALQPQLEAKTGPRLATYRLYRAQALSQLGQHEAAARAHADNGRLGYPDGFPNACAEARLAGDWSSLLTYAGEMLQGKPTDPQAQAWKGEALTRLGQYAEAEPVLQAAVQADPNQAMPWNNLGRCLEERKDWAEARVALDHALALDPKEYEALFNRGRCLFELHEYASSRDDFRAALALRPNDPASAENLRQAERYAAIQAPRKARH